MRRRTLLRRLGSVGVASALTGTVEAAEPVRVGFFVSDDVWDAEPVNSASRAAQRRLDPLTQRPLEVGPIGVVESVPSTETAAATADWWAEQRRSVYRHVNVLCVGRRSWEHMGYALYQRPHCVVSFTGLLDTEWGEWLVLHEIGHVLGARHHHADGTIMEPDWKDVDTVAYSGRTKRLITEQL